MLESINKSKCLEWKMKFYNLCEKYSKIPFYNMGFTKDWRRDSFWAVIKTETVNASDKNVNLLKINKNVNEEFKELEEV